LQNKFLQLADNLRLQKNRKNRAGPYVGGIDVGDVWAHEQDQTVVHTDFGTGMHDNLREGGSYGGATKRDLLGGPW
jgi:hypothetical protein